MGIKINTQELYCLLENTPPQHNIMLSGTHGIGKSRILTAYFQTKGIPVVTLFLGQMSDPGDLIGLPDKDTESGKTVFRPPYWFPVDNTPVVLFLDELNRARPEILQTIMDLALNRKLADRQLPEGSRIISAVNEGDEYQLTDLDPALVSRFNIYTFSPTVGEWLLWAAKAGLDQRVIDFISGNPKMLDGDGLDTSGASCLEKTPDRRAWERVSDILRGGTDLAMAKKIAAGIIGMRAAASFFGTLGKTGIVEAKKVLSDFRSVRQQVSKYDAHELALLNENIFRYLESGKSANAKSCADNLLEYLEWMAGGGSRESMAHFCSLFEQASYSRANLFMMTDAVKCFRMITDFIKSL